MASRAANATIKGYYYQFDTSILKILELALDTDSITIEGVEDIDIDSSTEQSAIQCKYLSKPKFINSAVREPITLMLDHFVAVGPKLKYTLYAHFEDEVGGKEQVISLSDLKDILTYTENKIPKCHYSDNGISDQVLTDFLTNFKFVFGKEFTVQQNEVVKMLKKEFNCSDFEADALYYNNGLRVVIDKAILPNLTQRSLTKGDFKTAINKSKLLFNQWYIRLRSKKEFLKNINAAITKTTSNSPTKAKYIFIGKNILNADNSEYTLLTLIENLIYKYYRLNHSLRNAKPVTLILDLDKSGMLAIKKLMIDNSITFNDGHEEISFNEKSFNTEPIINTSTNLNKIAKSSFSIKLIAKQTLVDFIGGIAKPKVVFHFSDENCPYIHAMEYQVFDVKYCENLKDIATVIA
jgi:hypothetical protein